MSSSSHMRPTFSNLTTLTTDVQISILQKQTHMDLDLAMALSWTFSNVEALHTGLRNSAVHSNFINILWTVSMWRLRLNTRLNTIWHTGHLVCPWWKLLWCVRESWRPNFFPQSLQTKIRGWAGAVNTDDPLNQPQLSCIFHLETKGRKILQHKYSLKHKLY